MSSSSSESTADFYLASTSPRRSELLLQAGYRFATLQIAIDETALEHEPAPQLALRLARAKAETGWEQVCNGQARPVLGADTVVLVADQLLGKPADEQDAARMLRCLSGRSHRVLTAVAVCERGVLRSVLSDTLVQFRELGAQEILEYCAGGEPCGKAGGYAIQGWAAVFVERIEGSYSGVVGLPLCETAQLLQSFDVRPWRRDEQ